MKKLGMLLAILALGALIIPVANAWADEPEEEDFFIPGTDESIRWGDYDKDFPKHEKKKKPVIIYFFAPKQDAFCKPLETNIFTYNGVKSSARKFYCFKIDSKGNPSVAKKHGMDKGGAALIVLDFQDTVIHKITDAPGDAKEFANLLKDAYKLNEERKKLLKKLQKWVKLANKYFKKKDARKGYIVWAEIIKHKGEVKYDKMDEIAEKYAQLLKDAAGAVKQAIERGMQTYKRLRGSTRNLGSTGQCDQLLRELQQAMTGVNRVNIQYPLPQVKEALSDVQSRLSQLISQVAAEKARILKEEEEERKK